jgi:hypothetical protein
MGVTASAPFNGVDDENLAIAYISTLILVFFVSFFAPRLLHGIDVELTVSRDHPLPSWRVSDRRQRF